MWLKYRTWVKVFLTLVLILLYLMTGTCVMTWTACRSAVWMQVRGVKWSAPWKTYIHTKMSVSLPSSPALIQVWSFTCQLMYLLLLIISLNSYSCGCVGHKGNVTPLYVREQQMAVCWHGYITNKSTYGTWSRAFSITESSHRHSYWMYWLFNFPSFFNEHC